MLGRIALLSGLLSLLLGCGSDDGPSSPTAASCPDDHRMGGACVGVPAAALCSESACTSGVTCSNVIEVRSADGLGPALSGAKPGSCIALDPGSYGDIVLPGSVSLLGKGVDFVSVGHVALGSGMGAVLRGITVSGGVDLDAATGIRIEATRIASSPTDGLRVEHGASVTLVTSEILDAADYGIRAFDTGDVAVQSTYVSGSKGPGMWVQCATGCDCAAQPTVTLDRAIVRDSIVVGVSLVGVSAKMADARVSDNGLSTNFQPAAGVSVSGCSTLEAKRIEIADNTYFGMLLDHAAATLGGADPADGFTIARNLFGLWIQHGDPNQSVTVSNGVLTANRGVGVGFSGSTHGIIINYFEVTKTQFEAMPVLANGMLAASMYVCDAVSWQDASQAVIDHLTLAGNSVPPAVPPPAPPHSARACSSTGPSPPAAASRTSASRTATRPSRSRSRTCRPAG